MQIRELSFKLILPRNSHLRTRHPERAKVHNLCADTGSGTERGEEKKGNKIRKREL